MRALRRRTPRWLFAWLLLVLAAQPVAAAYCASSGPGAAAGRSVTLCTRDGVVTRQLGNDGTPLPAGRTGHHPHCTTSCCLPGTAALPATAPVLALPAVPAVPPLAPSIVRFDLSPREPGARGPPGPARQAIQRGFPHV